MIQKLDVARLNNYIFLILIKSQNNKKNNTNSNNKHAEAAIKKIYFCHTACMEVKLFILFIRVFALVNN